jgi:hypothetical protein
MSIIQFVHIQYSTWTGVYLDGRKIADGYFNIEELDNIEVALSSYGGVIGLVVKRVDKPLIWFTDLGSILPDRISTHIGTILSKPKSDSLINYYTRTY